MTEPIKNKRLIFVLSAPSGTGKTTISNKITGLIPHLRHSISHTTRAPRKNEIHERDYFFITREAFKEKIKKGDFLEWAEVVGNFYGTSFENVRMAERENCDLLFVIDVQGAENLRKLKYSGIFIFLLPPSLQELRKRLEKRNTNTPEEISKRLSKAREEISRYKTYDYVLVNNELEEAADQVRSIVIAERCRYSRFDTKQVDLELEKQS